MVGCMVMRAGSVAVGTVVSVAKSGGGLTTLRHSAFTRQWSSAENYNSGTFTSPSAIRLYDASLSWQREGGKKRYYTEALLLLYVTAF